MSENGPPDSLALAVLEAVAEAVLVVDERGTIVLANAAAEEMFGWPREELLGQAIERLIPEAQQEAHRAHRPGYAAAPRRRPMGDGGSEQLGRRRDGTELSVEVMLSPLQGATGPWVIASVRDVSEHRAAEAERMAALRELETAIEQCPAAISIVRGPGLQSVLVNRMTREIWGPSRDPTQGVEQLLDMLCGPDGVPLPLERFPAMRALRGERVEHERHIVRSPDGRTQTPYDINATPLLGDDGQVEGALVVAWNVTSVVELERLRNEWVSVIAHDLRQPIHGIRLLAQMLRRHVTKAPELMMRDIEGIIELVDRLTRMASDLLELSRLDARRLTLEWTELDLVELVRATVPRYELADAALRVEVKDEIPRIEADPQRLVQVLDKLLGNAVKFRAPATPIEVRIARVGERVVVEVSNEGAGIAPDDLPRLFQRFERVAKGASDAPGIGLGLQIARGLVEAHGGEISARSVPGGETVFQLTLPLRRPSAPSSGGSRSGRRTIG